MKRAISILLALVFCLTLCAGAFASGEAGGKSTADMSPSSYGTLTYWKTDSMREHRDDTGHIYLGYAVENDIYNGEESNWSDPGSPSIVLDAAVEGEGFTAVYADNSTLDITGALKLTDDASGERANDFNGIGAAVVASSGSVVTLDGLDVETHGFMRDSLIVEEGSVVYVNDSTLAAYGANPLTDAYEGYRNSENQDRMISPPWVLGIQGGGRTVNLLSETPTLVVKNSELISGGWAVLSVDDCSAGRIYVFDSLIKVAPEAEGGMDDGGELFGYEKDYGSGYGSYYIGNPTEYFYGAHFEGETYAGILTGAELGYYGSSASAVDIVTGDGETLESAYTGNGEPTTIDTVFGWMAHGSGTIVAAEGTQIHTAAATFLSKASGVDFTIAGADTTATSGTGILYQMIDNDDRTVGNYADDDWGMTNFNDRLVEDSGLPSQASEGGSGEPSGDASGESSDASEGGMTFSFTEGFVADGAAEDSGAAETADASASGESSMGSGEMGGNSVTITDGASITGDIYNGTGYYGQNAGELTVTVSGGGTLNGAVALTETIHGTRATPEALAALKNKYTNIEYELMDASWNITENEAEAAYIHFTTFTINEYFCLGQVLNHIYYNGESTLDVVVEEGSVWNVTGESLITSISGGGTVNGVIRDNGDGTLSVYPAPRKNENGQAVITNGAALLVEDSCAMSGITLDASAVIESASADKAVTMLIDGIQVNFDYDSFLFYADDPDLADNISVAADGLVTVRGDIRFYITDFDQIFAANMGQQVPATIRTAEYYMDGEYDSALSIDAAETVDADGMKTIVSKGDDFNGILLRGSEGVASDYTLRDYTFDLSGYGSGDTGGLGAAVRVVGTDVTANLDNFHITTNGATRTAIFVGGSAVTNVTDSVIYAYGSQDSDGYGAVPAGVDELNNFECPWALGLYGDCRSTLLVGNSQVSYKDSVFVAYDWGVLSTDLTTGEAGITSADRPNFITFTAENDYIATIFSGYGAYSYRNAQDYFINDIIDTADMALIITGSDGSETYRQCFTDGVLDPDKLETTLDETEIGIGSFENCYVNAGAQTTMTHSGGYGVIDVKDSELHVKDTAFLVKDSTMIVNIENSTVAFDGTAEHVTQADLDRLAGEGYAIASEVDLSEGIFDTDFSGRNFFVDEDANNIVKLSHNFDGLSGWDKYQLPTTVYVTDSELEGNFVNTSAAAETMCSRIAGMDFAVEPPARTLDVYLTGSTVTGAITLGRDIWSEEEGNLVTVGGYPCTFVYAADQEFCPNHDDGYGLRLTLSGGSVWNVTETSYLTELTVEKGSQVADSVTVDGRPVDVTAGGSWAGEIVVSQ